MPYSDAVVHRHALTEPRDDDAAAPKDPYLLEVGVLSDQQQVVVIRQASDDLGVRYPPSIEREVLDVEVAFLEAAVEAKRDVLV